jgi:cell division protein FtsB
MKKSTLVNRIMGFLKGGDEAKVTRFETKLGKYFSKQIAMRNEKIENLKDKIVDQEEAMNDSVVNIDLEKINQTDGAESYCSSYVSKISQHVSNIEAYQAEIDVYKAEIARLEKVEATVYGEEKKAPEAPVN